MKRYFFLTVFLLACLLSCDKASEPVESDRTYSFHTDTLYCQRDGLNIFGIAYVPDGQNGQWPLVIYSHGIGSSHEAGEPYAQVLARKGYAVYTFDFCGANSHSKSDGNTGEMTIFTEQEDLTAIVGRLRLLPYIDSKRIYLLGISLGGLVSAMTAASIPDDIRGLILLYPALCAPDDARKIYDEDGTPLNPHGRGMGGDYYNKAMLKYDPFEHIGAYTKPVYIIHGTADKLVPITYSERAVNVYPDARLERIEGAGHGFKGEVLDKAIQLVGIQLDEWERRKP